MKLVVTFEKGAPRAELTMSKMETDTFGAALQQWAELADRVLSNKDGEASQVTQSALDGAAQWAQAHPETVTKIIGTVMEEVMKVMEKAQKDRATELSPLLMALMLNKRRAH